MDILKQLKQQAEQVEVLSLQDEKTTVEYEANQLKTCTVAETKGTAVRVIRKGQLGFAASTDDTVMDKLAANALESAAYGDAAPFSFPASQPAPAVRTFDQVVADLPIARLVEIGNSRTTAFMCAETDPAHCHRSFIADALLARGIEVLHLMAPQDVRAHALREGARLAPGGQIVYDACVQLGLAI